jgi:hypothetical protein
MINDLTAIQKLKSILIKKCFPSIGNVDSRSVKIRLTYRDSIILQKIGLSKKYYRTYYLIVKDSSILVRKKVMYEEKDSIKKNLKLMNVKKTESQCITN